MTAIDVADGAGAFDSRCHGKLNQLVDDENVIHLSECEIQGHDLLLSVATAGDAKLKDAAMLAQIPYSISNKHTCFVAIAEFRNGQKFYLLYV